MVEFSQDDAHRAQNIVDDLLSDERRDARLDKDLSIIDIEKDADEFRDQLDIISRFGGRFPAMRIEDDGLVPMSLSLFGLYPFSSFGRRRRPFRHLHPHIDELRYFYVRDLIRSLDEDTLSPEEARSTFLKRATSFLATRIAAIRMFRHGEPAGFVPTSLNVLQRFGRARIITPGCSFSVSTNSPGLRVFWSGAYYVSANYFGHPTSPTGSVLQSGTYIFGVDGGAYGNDVQWDTVAVCSLPGKPFVHLNY